MTRKYRLLLLLTGILLAFVIGIVFVNPTTRLFARIDQNPMRGYYEESGMPSYPRAMEFPLGGSITSNQSTIRMSYFITPDSPLKIANFYGPIWESEGLPVVEDISPKGGKISAVDFKRGVVKQVMIEKRGPVFYVFPSVVKNPFGFSKKQEIKGIPIHPHSKGVNVIRSQDLGQETEIVTMYNDMSLKSNIKYYLKEMKEMGWMADPKKDQSRSNSYKSQAFYKGEREAVVSFTKMSPKRTYVYITQTDREMFKQNPFKKELTP